MTKFLLPLLLLGAAVPAVAASTTSATAKPIAFERDGVRYVATIKTVGPTMVISGYEVDSGKTFELRSVNGRVSGTYGVTTVNYTVGR